MLQSFMENDEIPGMEAEDGNPSSWEVEAEGLVVQGQPELHEKERKMAALPKVIYRVSAVSSKFQLNSLQTLKEQYSTSYGKTTQES